MEDSYRESIWRKKGHRRELYPDVSCMDAPVPPEEPIPNCDCGHGGVARKCPETLLHCLCLVSVVLSSGSQLVCQDRDIYANTKDTRE